MASTSTPCAFIMRVSDPPLVGEAFIKLQLDGCVDAGDAAARACDKFPHWVVNAGQVGLFLVLGGREEARSMQRNPLSAAGTLQREPLFADDPVIPGSWLLARVPPPVAAAPGALGASCFNARHAC